MRAQLLKALLAHAQGDIQKHVAAASKHGIMSTPNQPT